MDAKGVASQEIKGNHVLHWRVCRHYGAQSSREDKGPLSRAGVTLAKRSTTSVSRVRSLSSKGGITVFRGGSHKEGITHACFRDTKYFILRLHMSS
jgi:hypothetical protein